MSDLLEQLDNELEVSHAFVMASSEKWAKSYAKAPKQHAKLVRTQAKVAKALRKYFRELAQRAPRYVDWSGYHVLKADKLKINIVFHDDDFYATEDSEFMNSVYDPLASATTLGASAAEEVYARSIGLSGTSAAIQNATRGQIAQLVGKKLDKDGNIVDNPNPRYNINETTRNQIEESIRTSMNLGETTQDAISRLQDVIYDPDRAELIANTETVNAYQAGQATYAREAEAVGKEWISSNGDDVCGENTDAGIIGIDEDFPSGDSEPVAHPNCLCDVRYVFPEEMDNQDAEL